MLMLLACAPAIAPVANALFHAARSPEAWSDIPMNASRWVLIARSLGMAGLIATIATLLAIPIARLLRHAGPKAAALILAPLWLPAWLAYAGLNLARAPDTFLGGAILELALPDHRWAIVLLGRTVAVASLVLWSVPVAALVLAATRDPDASAADELLRTEAIPMWQRTITRLRLEAVPLRTAFVVIALLTVGSSIPLHLAQIETDAIVLWRAISERTPDRWAGVWLGAWPELLIAGVGSVWLVARFAGTARSGEGASPMRDAPPGPWTRFGGWAIWSLAALLPTGLMLWSLDDLASLWHWLTLNAEALRASGTIAGLGGLIAGSAGVLIAAGRASERGLTRAIAGLAACGCVFGMLVPGVLVGIAIAGMGLEQDLSAILAGAARTLVLGGIIGLIVGKSETPDARAMRSLDARGDAFGWIAVHPARALRLFAGVWAGAFLIGLHEIEASTLVRPPGTANLPQQMLSDLHYARLEQLSAGGVIMGLLGITLGIGAAWLLSLRVGQPRADRAVPPPI